MTVTHAQIEPTTRCNYTCGFCAGRAMTQRDLGWEAFTAFLDAHPDLRRVELQGEGEPLLHKRFFDMVAECARRGIAVGLITNGSLLDEAAVEHLLAGGVESIHISMESADPVKFQAIRGGKFAKVRDGIARLMARKRALGLARPVVGLTVTVLRSTLATFGPILDLYEAEGLDGGIMLQPLQSMPAYSRHYAPATRAEVMSRADLPSYVELFREAQARAPVRSTGDFFYTDLFAGFDPRSANCPWLARGAYLGAGGAITGCCFMKDESMAFAPAIGGAATAAALRRHLADMFEHGAVPAACVGWGTATSIANSRRASLASHGPAA